jgi:hypothetical protein
MGVGHVYKLEQRNMPERNLSHLAFKLVTSVHKSDITF